MKELPFTNNCFALLMFSHKNYVGGDFQDLANMKSFTGMKDIMKKALFGCNKEDSFIS
jgi:hypothetical protein